MAEKDFEQFVRIIAPQLGVNAEALLMKTEKFPGSPDPGQLQAFLNEVEARFEDFTEAEHTVLVLAGKSDEIAPAAEARKLKSALVEVLEFEDARHDLFHEAKTAETVASLIGWLDSRLGR